MAPPLFMGRIDERKKAQLMPSNSESVSMELLSLTSQKLNDAVAYTFTSQQPVMQDQI